MFCLIWHEFYFWALPAGLCKLDCTLTLIFFPLKCDCWVSRRKTKKIKIALRVLACFTDIYSKPDGETNESPCTIFVIINAAGASGASSCGQDVLFCCDTSGSLWRSSSFLIRRDRWLNICVVFQLTLSPRWRCGRHDGLGVPQGHVFDKSDDNSWICWLYFFGSSQNLMRFCTGVSSGPPHVRHLSFHKVVSCLAFCKKWNKNRFFNSADCSWSFIAFSFFFFFFTPRPIHKLHGNNTITDLILRGWPDSKTCSILNDREIRLTHGWNELDLML